MCCTASLRKEVIILMTLFSCQFLVPAFFYGYSHTGKKERKKEEFFIFLKKEKMVWKKRKKKESGAVSVIWWRMCLGNYGPGQNFNCQRTLTMFFFFFTCCTQQNSLSHSRVIYTHTLCVSTRDLSTIKHTEQNRVCTKKKMSGNKKKRIGNGCHKRKKKERKKTTSFTYRRVLF